MNPRVAAYLLADEEPDMLPDSYSLGSQEEAVICVAELRPAFAATPGALNWLRTQIEPLKRDSKLRSVAQQRRDRNPTRKHRPRKRRRRRR